MMLMDRSCMALRFKTDNFMMKNHTRLDRLQRV